MYEDALKVTNLRNRLGKAFGELDKILIRNDKPEGAYIEQDSTVSLKIVSVCIYVLWYI